MPQATNVPSAPTYGSERVVYLPEELVTILSEHVATQVGESEPGQWLFTVGVRLRDLGHFYASGLIAAGCDVVTVQRALGHLWSTAEDRTRVINSIARAVVDAQFRDPTPTRFI